MQSIQFYSCNCCLEHFIIRAPSSEFVSTRILSWQILTAHAQPFRGARDLVFCLKVPLDSLLVWPSSADSGETAQMHRLAWTFAARIGDKYQIRLTRPIHYILFSERESYIYIYEPTHDKTNKIACSPIEDSDQPWHPPSLIRVFVVRMKKHWVFSYPLSAQWRLWPDWTDAQADLSLRWAHMPFCWFCHKAAHFTYPENVTERSRECHNQKQQPNPWHLELS